MYALLSSLFGLALDLFFDRRHLAGEVPNKGPVLLVANHPNALVDPVVVARTAGRRVRFLAKEPLFHSPVIKWFVKGMGCLPVYRSKDGHDTSKNEGTFRAVHEALADGAAICLFPEGISHDLPQVQPMKTGAARMALGAAADHDWKLGVRIVPMGLIYRDKTKFRSDLVTQVGDPIAVADYKDDDERAAARKLTDAIDESIRSLTLNMTAWEDKPLLELAERIYKAQGETRVARLQRLADRAMELRRRFPERYFELRERAESFKQLLRRLGLRADSLEASYSVGEVLAFAGRNLVALCVGLPVALAGTLAYAVPYALVKAVAALMAPKVDVDEIAGVKIMASLLFFPLWQIALSIALGLLLPWTVSLPLLVALPFAGLYADHFYRRRHAALADLRAFLLVTFVPRARARLKEERDALRGEIEAVAALLDAEPMHVKTESESRA